MDHVEFFHLCKGKNIFLVVYVDNIVTVGDESKGIDYCKLYLQ